MILDTASGMNIESDERPGDGKTISSSVTSREAGDEPPMKRQPIDERQQVAREERKAQRRAKSGSETSSSDVRSLFEEELESYEKQEKIVSRDFYVLR